MSRLQRKASQAGKLSGLAVVHHFEGGILTTFDFKMLPNGFGLFALKV
jgi:hypothetical protein